jgi:hypothetical protein
MESTGKDQKITPRISQKSPIEKRQMLEVSKDSNLLININFVWGVSTKPAVL